MFRYINLFLVFTAITVFLPPKISGLLEDVIEAVGDDSVSKMIDDLRQKSNVHTESIDLQNNPVIEYGERKVPNVRVPWFIVAKIRKRHVGHPRTAISNTIQPFLVRNMGFRVNNDERGHILAHTLGGPSDQTYNFMPMTKNLNRGRNNFWSIAEVNVSKFLKENGPNSLAVWKSVVIYPENWVLGQRPIGICFRYDLYLHDSPPQLYEADGKVKDVCFSNDPADTISEYWEIQ